MEEISRMIAHEVEKKLLAATTDCFSGASTYANTPETQMTKESILESIAMVKRFRPAPQIRVFPNAFMVETIQTKFPKSKKRRIRRKFAKLYTKSVPMMDAYLDKANGRLFCHPLVAEKIKKYVEKRPAIQAIGF